eukprot:459537_1
MVQHSFAKPRYPEHQYRHRMLTSLSVERSCFKKNLAFASRLFHNTVSHIIDVLSTDSTDIRVFQCDSMFPTLNSFKLFKQTFFRKIPDEKDFLKRATTVFDSINHCVTNDNYVCGRYI